jgi:hypothetical protein
MADPHREISKLALAGALLIVGAHAVMGQAGRRLPPPRSTPPLTQPSPSPTPTPAKPAKAQFSLKVVRDIPQTLYLSFPFPERMETWTVDRLKRSPLLEVAAGEPANHNQAVRLAKSETEAFIVWLQLEDNPFVKSEPSGRRPVSGEVRINFWILTPVTGKTKYSGTVFLDQPTRGVGLRKADLLCYPGVRADDYLLLQASLAAAARIMEYLKVPVTAACP